MKKSFFAYLAIAIGVNCYSQNNNLNYKYALKLSNIITINNTNKIYGTSTKTSENYFLQPSLTFQIRTKTYNFHEWEAYDISLWNYKSGIEYATAISKASCSYRYIANFNKKQDAKWIPSMGSGINSYFQYYKRKEIFFGDKEYYSHQQYGIKLFLQAGVTRYFSSRFFMSVSAAFNLMNIECNIHKDIISAQSNYKVWYNPKGQAFNFIAGIGLKL